MRDLIRWSVLWALLVACESRSLEEADPLEAAGYLSVDLAAPCDPTDCPPCDSCGCENCCPASPVIIDTAGDGFDLTSPSDGVAFDIRAKGVAEQIAWTAPNSDDAWLALDRNGSGTIDNGSELFGNFTNQPPSDDKNGFLALAAFDDPGQGGNADGIIDSHDAVWERLRLWQDRNHDGVTQPGELHTLPELGVQALELRYTKSARKDSHGNIFRYRARVHGVPRSRVGHFAYDVFLRSDGVPPNAAYRELRDLRRMWRSQGITHRAGSFDTPEGQRVLRALKAAEMLLPQEQRILQTLPVTDVDAGTRSELDAGTGSIGPSPSPTNLAPLPTCNGVFPSIDDAGRDVGTAYLQQSTTVGIGWQLLLALTQAPMGIIVFEAQISAGGYPANVYAPHTEFWNYAFHGTIPLAFPIIGLPDTCRHTLQRGDFVQFTWFWRSLVPVPPATGGSGYITQECQFF